MAQQVKFYSTTVASFSALGENKDPAGVYFVDGGELYKGAQRFGLGRVTVAASTTGIAGAERGDIVVTGSGAGWVYVDSTTGWKPIGGDTSALQSAWQADISTWTSGLVAGGEGSYITGITQGADGKVTASAAAFPTLNLDSHTEGGSSNGIQVSVTTQSGAVTGVTVTNPFVATSSYATGNDGGVYVSVFTENGQVTEVNVTASELNVTSISAASGSFTDLTVTDTATFSATTVSATTLTVGGVAVNNIASSTVTSSANGITVGVTTENGGVKAVTLDATSFGNVMHFVGVVSVSASVPASPEDGDIIVIGAATSEALSGIKTKLGVTNDVVQGQEYIYNGTGWELIGDQKTYATATALSGVASRVSALETSMSTRASVGTGTATASYGVSGKVVLTANAQPTMSIAVAPVTTSAGITSTSTSLATASAIKAYVDGVVSALPDVTGGTDTSASKGVSVQVTISADTAVPDVTTTVSLQTSITTACTDDEIPSAKAVSNALCWCGANGQPLN